MVFEAKEGIQRTNPVTCRCTSQSVPFVVFCRSVRKQSGQSLQCHSCRGVWTLRTAYRPDIQRGRYPSMSRSCCHHRNVDCSSSVRRDSAGHHLPAVSSAVQNSMWWRVRCTTVLQSGSIVRNKQRQDPCCNHCQNFRRSSRNQLRLPGTPVKALQLICKNDADHPTTL
jgi:hypothetical protein